MEPTDLVDMLVSDVLRSVPAATQVFVGRGMSCPGCPFACFETIAEAASAYRLDARELAQALVESHQTDSKNGL